MSDINCHMPLNPDVAGVGVRFALYIQVTLGYILSVFSLESVLEASISIILTSTIFMVAALSEAKSGNVSELDSYLLFLLSSAPLAMASCHNLAVMLCDLSKLESKQKLGHRYYLTRAISLTLRITYIILWCVWHWVVHSRTVGSGEYLPDNECSPNEEFVILTAGYKHEKARANDIYHLRDFYTTGVASGVIFLVECMFIYHISQIIWNKRSQVSKVQSGDKSDNDKNQDNHNHNNNNNESEEDDRAEGQEDEVHIVRAIRIGKLIVTDTSFLPPLMTRIIFGSLAILQLGPILRIEKTIAANNVLESYTWSFGQITAFCPAMVHAIYSLYKFIMKWRTGKERGRVTGNESGVETIWLAAESSSRIVLLEFGKAKISIRRRRRSRDVNESVQSQ